MIYILLAVSVFGFLPFLIVLYKQRRVQRMKSEGIASEGIVIDILGASYNKINTMFIEYHVVETGETIRRKLLIAGNPYRIGDKIPVYYKNDNPEKMVIDPGKTNIAMFIFTLLIAAVVIFGCYMINKDVQAGRM